jgi:putative Ig domain-containing protein
MYFWTALDDLPPGMKLSEDGAVDGVPTKAGTYSFAVSVIEIRISGGSADASRSYTLTIDPA